MKNIIKLLNTKTFLNKKSGVFQRYMAFTLAEVLITLGIIGVIAESTIPTLVQNVKTQVYKTPTKKAYSVIDQATTTILANSGSSSLVGTFTDALTTANLYASQLRTLNVCTSGSCPYTLGTTTKPVITTADGMLYKIVTIDTNCNTAWGTANFGEYLCTEFYVDINGNKPPNAQGQDEVWFGVAPDGSIVPAGSPQMVNAAYACPNGVYCSTFTYLYN